MKICGYRRRIERKFKAPDLEGSSSKEEIKFRETTHLKGEKE